MVLGAGPIGTVPLLHRSKGGLSHLSSALGKWVSNNGDVNFLFQVPETYPDHTGYKSTNNAGAISYAFWQKHRVTMHPGFSPVGVMAGIDVRLPGKRPFGLEHKLFVKKNALHRLIPVNAMRQIPAEMTMGIGQTGMAKVHVPLTKALREHGPYMVGLARRVADPIGGQVLITGIGNRVLDLGGNHILGGARISDDPRFGVCDPNGEVYGHPGLYIADAAAIPSTLGINPALTIGANALRTASHIERSFGTDHSHPESPRFLEIAVGRRDAGRRHRAHAHRHGRGPRPLAVRDAHFRGVPRNGHSRPEERPDGRPRRDRGPHARVPRGDG